MTTIHAYSSPLPPHGEAAPRLETGRVLAVSDGGLRLQARDGCWQAQLAASCLLRPQCEDEVLFAPLPDGRAFVLAVLTRAPGEAVIAFPHGAALQSPLPIRLDSLSALQMSAPKTAVVTADLRLEAVEATATLDRANLVVRLLRSAGERLEQTFEKLLGRFGSSWRMVREEDDLQARNVRVAAQEGSLTQAASITQLAGEVARIDAPQVHIS